MSKSPGVVMGRPTAPMWLPCRKTDLASSSFLVRECACAVWHYATSRTTALLVLQTAVCGWLVRVLFGFELN